MVNNEWDDLGILINVIKQMVFCDSISYYDFHFGHVMIKTC
jgi:hypothetical protein